MRLVLAAALKIVAKPFDHRRAKRELLRFRKVLPQTRVVCQRLRGDGLNEGDQLLAQRAKDLADGLGCQAIIRVINQRVRNVFIAGKEIRQLPAQVECLLQQWAHRRKIIGGPGLSPSLIRRGRVFG